RWAGVHQQSGNLLEHLTVAQNVRLARSLSRRDREGVSVEEALARVGMEGRAGARPGTLSGGEAARAGLAVALANDPPVLIADEPTGEIDRGTEGIVLDLLRARAADGKAVLVVTHSQRVAKSANRLVRLRDGRIHS